MTGCTFCELCVFMDLLISTTHPLMNSFWLPSLKNEYIHLKFNYISLWNVVKQTYFGNKPTQHSRQHNPLIWNVSAPNLFLMMNFWISIFISQVTECCPILPTHLAKLTRKVWWRTPRPYGTREAVSSRARWSGEPASPSAAHGKTATGSRTRRTSLSFPRHLTCLGTCEKTNTNSFHM